MSRPKIIEVPWIDDPLGEHDLNLSGLPFAPELVPYSSIDIQGGLHNRAREHSSLIEELWEDYAQKMEAGNPFKRIVLYTVNDGVFKYCPAHGNHRLRALAYVHNDDTPTLKSSKVLVGAYVIPTGYTDDIEEFERLANNKEGARQSAEYALRNAIWLVQNRNVSLKRAAERTGLKPGAISNSIRANDTRSRIENLGVDTHCLSEKHLTRLGSLKHDSHIKHLATIANEGKISSDDLSKLVTDVNHRRTEAKGNEHIHDTYNRMRREMTGPKNGKKPPELKRRDLFLKGLRAFEDMWLRGPDGNGPINNLSDVGIAAQDVQVRKELASRGKDLVTVLERVLRLKKGK